VSNVSETKETKIARKGVLITAEIICIILIAGIVTTIAVYALAISSLNSKVTNLQKQVNDLQNTTDFDRFFLEFGNVSLQSPNINFSLPVNMYRALTIALGSDGWNASSLSNMAVQVSLGYWGFWSNSSVSGYEWLHSVTQPAKDYSVVQVNGTTYRYIWEILVEPSGNIRDIPPPGLYLVDAATGEIVPHGILG